MDLISLLKKLPIDVGQAERKHDSAGKRIAFSFVPNGIGKAALDIGCRDGWWSERLKERGYAVESLDLAPSYAGARKHDIEGGLPFGEGTFDLVWCTEVIEHLRNPKNLLREIQRVLKPGGVVILTAPNSAWWFYSVVRVWGWTPQRLQNADHKQFFSEQDIRGMMPGYEPYGYFPYAIFFLSIRHFIGFLSPTFIMVRRP